MSHIDTKNNGYNFCKTNNMRHYYLLVLILCLHLPNGESAYAQTAGEVCYNPNLVKDTTKKSIKSMAVGLIGVIA